MTLRLLAVLVAGLFLAGPASALSDDIPLGSIGLTLEIDGEQVWGPVIEGQQDPEDPDVYNWTDGNASGSGYGITWESVEGDIDPGVSGSWTITNTASLVNSGSLGALTTSGSVTNSGSAGATTMTAGSLDNSGTLASLAQSGGTATSSGSITGAAEVTGGSLTVTGAYPNLGPSAENLVLRAASAFAHATGIQQSFQFALEKKIPPGAGLGDRSGCGVEQLRRHPLEAGVGFVLRLPDGAGPAELSGVDLLLIPVGALDQPDRHAAPAAATPIRDAGILVAAAEVGLHRQAALEVPSLAAILEEREREVLQREVLHVEVDEDVAPGGGP